MNVATVGPKPQVVLDCRNDLAECVLWDNRESRLWWTNITAATLWSWDPFGSADPEIHVLPERVGAFGFREREGLILGLASGFACYDPASRKLEHITAIEHDLPSTRLNDGRVDPFGRFVCGGMDEAAEQEGISAVYVLDEKRSVSRIVSGVHCANSIGWSLDTRRMYFSDMPSREISIYSYGRSLSGIRLLSTLARLRGPGLADGSQVDAEGCLWNAEWGGGRLVRYGQGGAIDREIPLPVTNPTVLRGYWWWWAPPIFMIALIFIGLFLTSVGFDRFANPRLARR